MIKKYYCRVCKGDRNHKEIHKVSKSDSYNNEYFWSDNYCIIECKGCDNISFLHIHSNSDMENVYNEGYTKSYTEDTIYPYYLKKGEKIKDDYLIPHKIREIYIETISALQFNSLILTAGGLRAIVEAITKHLNIRKDELSQSIDALFENKHLTLNESKRLHSIRFIGNAALHEIDKPTEEQLYVILEIINHLLINLFINDKKIKGHFENLTVIDKYPDFIKLIKALIRDNMVEKKLTLTEILGKMKKRLTVNAKNFENRLKIEIQSGKYDFISLDTDKKKDSIYLINKNPEIFE